MISHSLFSRLTSPVVFWPAVFVALFWGLQHYGVFHFFYIEQEQLFLFSRPYWLSVGMQPGGVARLLAEYGIQFFVHPYVGALIMSALFTCIGLLTAAVLKRAAPSIPLYPSGLLPVVMLLFVLFDTNYSCSGTVAYCLMLAALYPCFCISQIRFRAVYALFVSVILWWLAGAIAMLFAVCILLWEVLNRLTRSWYFLFPLISVTALAAGCIYHSLAGDARLLLLPDGYFNTRLQPGIVLYFSWVCLPVLLLFAFALRKTGNVWKGWKTVGFLCQIGLIAAIMGYGARVYFRPKAEFFKELSYYMQMKQWDRIIERCGGNLSNYLYKCCLNIALAEKNALAERMFAFDQQGDKSLHPSWSRTSHVSALLSDLYFSMGHIARAQQMAFESNVCTPSAGSPRMVQRLVQTNLIYGAYSVAEKYISLLEQTLYYRKWAQEQRRFLWNEDAIAADPVLGLKRKCLPQTDCLTGINNLDMELKQIAGQNPAHQVTMQYVGAFYLLTGDMEHFKALVDTYGGTDLLPALPKSYQEAVIILSEQYPAYLETLPVEASTLRRYRQFRQLVLANKNRPAQLPALLKPEFGETYWYYYLFKLSK
jgi:hypothetical protein